MSLPVARVPVLSETCVVFCACWVGALLRGTCLRFLLRRCSMCRVLRVAPQPSACGRGVVCGVCRVPHLGARLVRVPFLFGRLYHNPPPCTRKQTKRASLALRSNDAPCSAKQMSENIRVFFPAGACRRMHVHSSFNVSAYMRAIEAAKMVMEKEKNLEIHKYIIRVN